MLPLLRVMSSPPRITIDSLAAPSRDGETLIWPQAKSLLRMAEDNRRLREGFEFVLLGRSAKDWLAGDRRNAATSAEPLPNGRGSDGLVFMTGHQPAFFHPGVWAKTIVTAALAEKTGGHSRFLVVDSDVPHHISIQWPDLSGPYCRLRRKDAETILYNRSYEHITDHAEIVYKKMFSAIPDAFRRDSRTVFSAFEAGFLGWDRRPPSGRALSNGRGSDRGRDASATDGADYVDRWIEGMKSIEREVGVITPSFLRISDIFSRYDNPAGKGLHHVSAAGFVAHLLTQAEAFAAVYNQALAAYRQRRGIRGHQHPIPDLIISDDRIELPFWLVSPTEPRQRLMVSRGRSEDLHIFAGAHPVSVFMRDDLIRDPIKTLSEGLIDRQIRPRALVQTMYARIFACDLFIHGIGGAKYDQITDDVIRRFFNIEPPAYPCVSATLRLPIPRYQVTEDKLRALRHGIRDLRYNPQRALTAAMKTSEVKEWIAQRQEAVHESLRLRRERPKDRSARHAAFDRIRRMNANLLQAASAVQTETIQQIEDLTQQIAHNKVADLREWFFALYPRESLLTLRDTLRGSIH